MDSSDLMSLTADIVSAHVSNNAVESGDLPALIAAVHAALTEIEAPTVPQSPRQEPAVSVRSSVKQDYIVCLEDGKKLKMLKRYLRTEYAMTPDDYRTKWGLPKDYPMVAPAYAERRRGLALRIGLGRKTAVESVTLLAKSVTDHAPDTVDAVEEAIVQAVEPTPQTRDRPAEPKTETTMAAKPARKRLGIAGAKAAARDHLGSDAAADTEEA